VGKIRELWKQREIVPIHKIGPKNLAPNYRPVSIICVECKRKERTLKERITAELRGIVINLLMFSMDSEHEDIQQQTSLSSMKE